MNMKRITLLGLLLLGGVSVFAQNLDLLYEGRVLENNEEIQVTAYDEYNVMHSGIFVKNQGTENVEATLEVNYMEGDGSISYCGFKGGTCTIVPQGGKSARTATCEPGEEVDANVEFRSLKEQAKGKVKFTLTSGSMVKSVIVNFLYDTKAIGSTLVNNQVTISQNGNVAELNYNFDTNANRMLNVYNVTGAKIMSDNLAGNNGTLSLSLEKGIYIYSVVQNGKVVATHKFVVR